MQKSILLLFVLLPLFVCCTKDIGIDEKDLDISKVSYTDTVLINGKFLLLAEPELIYTDSNIPIRYDGSLSTIKKDNSAMYFFHSYGCRIEPSNLNNSSSHTCFLGADLDPLDKLVFDKKEDDYWDYNGYYQDRLQEGVWILGIYKRDNGDLLAITHSETNYAASDEAFLYTLGIGYSKNNGENWTYCGEIVRPARETLNIGGGAYIIVGEYIYVYYNDWITVGRVTKGQICVARARLGNVLEDAENKKVGTWHKHRDGKWNIPGLSDTAGTAVIPVVYGGEDCHSDATYCTSLEKYFFTVQASQASNLLLFSSSDGIDWKHEIVLDQSTDVIMPYSSFVDFDGPKDDCSEVDNSFYIYYPHKDKNDHDIDKMFRRLVTVE